MPVSLLSNRERLLQVHDRLRVHSVDFAEMRSSAGYFVKMTSAAVVMGMGLLPQLH